MKKTIYTFSMLIFGILFSSNIYSQTTINGTITDETGSGLIGAAVLIQNTTIGTVTDIDGNYSLTSDVPLPWNIEYSFVGYTTVAAEVISGGNQPSITLSEGVNFNQEVVISASRKQEKAVDAPASISVLSPERLSVVADQGNPVNALKNTVGVSVINQGIDRSAIQLRGSAIFNKNRVQVYKDYRPMTQFGSANFESQLTPIMSVDVKQVEVMRGPAGALYGPGVDAGVVHFLTLDPWDKCGTTVSLTGGENDLMRYEVRQAGTFGEKLGYKVLVGGMKATDFMLSDEVAARRQANEWGGATEFIGQPGTFLEGQTIVHNGNMVPDVGSRTVSTSLYYKPTDNISLTASFDAGRYTGNRRSVQGDTYFRESMRNFQLRGQIGNLFFAANRFVKLATNDTDDLSKQRAFNANFGTSFIGVQGENTEDKFELQYPMSLGPLDLTVGGDYLSWTPVGNTRVAGRFANQSYLIYGGYIQAKFDITKKLKLNAVARYDQFDAFGSGDISPRAALIYKPNPSSQFRVSYNRSFAAMNPVRTFLDFQAATPPFGAQLQFAGGGQGFDFENPILAGFPFAQGLNGASVSGDAIPLEGFFGPGPLAGALAAALGPDGLSALQAAAAGQTTAASFATFRDGIPVPTLDGYGAKPVGLTTTNTFEVGYKGTIGNKLAVQVDVYQNRIENFESNATPITPMVSADNLAADLAAIANSAGLDGAAVSAAVNSTPFGNGSDIAWVESSHSQTRPGGEGLPQINFGFLNFGEAKYWGYDAGLEYYINPILSVFTNYSGLSTNSFTLEDLGEDSNAGFPAQFLNTPKSRYRAGINYLKPTGFFGSIAMSHNSEYEAVSGVYRGTVAARTLVDLTAGYAMDNGLKLTLAVSNLLDNKFSYFPNLPEVTRVATLNLQYHFGGTCGSSSDTNGFAGNSANVSNKKLDSDGDGVKDHKDLCPNIPGLKKHKGCPKDIVEMEADAAAEAARVKAEEEARLKAEMEAKAKAEADAKRQAEEAAAKAIAEAEKAAKAKAEMEAAAATKKAEEEAAKAAAAKRTTEIKTETRKVFNAALTGIQFNSGNSTLKTSSNATLDNVVSVMNKYPEISVTIEGHTDSQGAESSNLKLSQDRAMAVRDYLIRKGISVSRLRSVGYGETSPIADNGTAAGRAQNRRVAFRVNQ